MTGNGHRSVVGALGVNTHRGDPTTSSEPRREDGSVIGSAVRKRVVRVTLTRPFRLLARPGVACSAHLVRSSSFVGLRRLISRRVMGENPQLTSENRAKRSARLDRPWLAQYRSYADQGLHGQMSQVQQHRVGGKAQSLSARGKGIGGRLILSDLPCATPLAAGAGELRSRTDLPVRIRVSSLRPIFAFPGLGPVHHCRPSRQVIPDNSIVAVTLVLRHGIRRQPIVSTWTSTVDDPSRLWFSTGDWDRRHPAAMVVIE